MNYHSRNNIFKYTTPGDYTLDIKAGKDIFITLAGGGGGGGKNNKNNSGGGGGSGYNLICKPVTNGNLTLNIKVGAGGRRSTVERKGTNGISSVVKFNENLYIARGGLKGKDGTESFGGNGGDGCSGGDGGNGIKGGLGGTGTPGSDGKTGKDGGDVISGIGGKGFHYELKNNSDGGNGNKNGKPGYVYVFIN